MFTTRVTFACLLLLTACADVDTEDGPDDVAFPDGKTDTLGYSDCELGEVLRWLNVGSSADDLRAAGLTSRPRRAILAHRDGPDATFGTADDDLFDDLHELDAVRYVGPTTLRRLVTAVADHCEEDPRLTLLNDPRRPSLPHECSYDTLDLAGVAGTFAEGSAFRHLAVEWDRRTMSCDDSGCHDTGHLETGVSSTYYPELRRTAAGGVEINADAWEPLASGDHVYSVAGIPHRFRATRYPNGLLCMSVVRYDASLTSYDLAILAIFPSEL
jgi:hypothetical protein